MFRIACVLIGYAFGCIQTAYIAGRVTKNIDIREHGSKNAGTSNTIRVLGRSSGLVVFLTDVLKALAAYFLASFIFKTEIAGLYAGLGAVLGHNFPFFLKFKGGKGIASSLGVYFAADWKAALILCAVGLVSVAATRYISLASLMITLLAPFVFWFFGYEFETVAVLACMAVMAWVLHRGNIVRIVTRTERKFTLKKIERQQFHLT